MRHILLFAVSTVLLSACGDTTAPVAEAPKPSVGSFGVDLAQMDATVRPGDDFYGYVNGNLARRRFQIPADRARYTTGTSVSEKTEADVRSILDELAASKGAPGTVAQKVGDLYASWMDEAGIESRGIEPLTPFSARSPR